MRKKTDREKFRKRQCSVLSGRPFNPREKTTFTEGEENPEGDTITLKENASARNQLAKSEGSAGKETKSLRD